MTEYENMSEFYMRTTNIVTNRIFVPESVKIFGKIVTPHVDENSFTMYGNDIIEYTCTLDDGTMCGITVVDDYEDDLVICSFINHENLEENYELDDKSDPDLIELEIRRMIDRLENTINEKKKKE